MRVVALVEFALAPGEDLLRQVVAALLEVADALDVAPISIVVDESQGAGAEEHPDHVVGPHRTGVDRPHDPHDFGPVPCDLPAVLAVEHVESWGESRTVPDATLAASPAA
jgi:hypothetical protein